MAANGLILLLSINHHLHRPVAMILISRAEEHSHPHMAMDSSYGPRLGLDARRHIYVSTTCSLRREVEPLYNISRLILRILIQPPYKESNPLRIILLRSGHQTAPHLCINEDR